MGDLTQLIAALVIAITANSARTRDCFAVHGRLYVANGTPSIRIWPVKTDRILGVTPDESPSALPDPLPRYVSFDNRIYADFRVCSDEPERRGRMRMVSIASVNKVVVEHVDPASGIVRVFRVKTRGE
ncbi:MAG: hypothetical protein DMF58_08295 [Acidobacteria bacterium]|nr:MAG: hypothetical protein DMF58_08295 [Acidobacteriota bacterium]